MIRRPPGSTRTYTLFPYTPPFRSFYTSFMASKRQDIIQAANRVFYREGFAEVGIDRLVDEADVALGTLYRHFRSRSDVVVGALEQRDADFLNDLERDATGSLGAEGVLRLRSEERSVGKEGVSTCRSRLSPYP